MNEENLYNIEKMNKNFINKLNRKIAKIYQIGTEQNLAGKIGAPFK